MTAPPPTVLFDLDGTLLNSIDFILDCFRHAFEANGLEPKPDQYWLDSIGQPIRTQMQPWDHDPELREALLATYRDYNFEHHDTRITAYDGVASLLARIADLGANIGLVTSKSKAGAERGLRVTKLLEFVTELVTADDVTNGKPHPEPVQTALKRFGGDPARSIFVGDSVHDMVSGRAAGVKTAAALWGPFSRQVLEPTTPDYWCETPGDVLRLVTDLNDSSRNSDKDR